MKKKTFWETILKSIAPLEIPPCNEEVMGTRWSVPMEGKLSSPHISAGEAGRNVACADTAPLSDQWALVEIIHIFHLWKIAEMSHNHLLLRAVLTPFSQGKPVRNVFFFIIIIILFYFIIILFYFIIIIISFYFIWCFLFVCFAKLMQTTAPCTPLRSITTAHRGSPLLQADGVCSTLQWPLAQSKESCACAK